jgi:hypothetical protein
MSVRDRYLTVGPMTQCDLYDWVAWITRQAFEGSTARDLGCVTKACKHTWQQPVSRHEWMQWANCHPVLQVLFFPWGSQINMLARARTASTQ